MGGSAQSCPEIEQREATHKSILNTDGGSTADKKNAG